MISSEKQIKIGAILSYLAIFLGIVTGLTFHPWMIKSIGDSDYGLYTLAMSLINMFLIDLGLGAASQRFISKYRAENDLQSVNNITGLIFKLYFAITAVLLMIFFVLFFLIENIYVRLTPEEMSKFKILYVMAAIYSISSFPFVALHGILSSHEQFIPLKICDLIHKIITVSLTAIALAIGYGVYILVVVNLISSLIFTAIRIYSIKKFTPVRPNFRYRDNSKIKEIFSFSIWTSISSVVMRLLLVLAPSILGIVSGSYEIAVFGYAVSLEGHVYSFVNAINGFFMPKISTISSQYNETDGAQSILNLMSSVGRFILLLFGLILVGFTMLGKEFIALLVGPEYETAYYCVLLICGYGIIAYPQQIANTYVVVKNKVRIKAIISLIAMALYALLAFAFGKMWGAIGISIAICAALVLQTILMNVVYYKVLGINVFAFFKRCHLKLFPGFMVIVILSLLISWIPISGWIGFFVKGVSIVVIYALTTWFIILNKQEKNALFKRKK